MTAGESWFRSALLLLVITDLAGCKPRPAEAPDAAPRIVRLPVKTAAPVVVAPKAPVVAPKAPIVAPKGPLVAPKGPGVTVGKTTKAPPPAEVKGSQTPKPQTPPAPRKVTRRGPDPDGVPPEADPKDPFWAAWRKSTKLPGDVPSSYDETSWLAPLLPYDKSVDEGKPLPKKARARKKALLSKHYRLLIEKIEGDYDLYKEGSRRLPIKIAWGEDPERIFVSKPSIDCEDGEEGKRCREKDDCADGNGMKYYCRSGKCVRNTLFNNCDGSFGFALYKSAEFIGVTFASAKAAGKFNHGNLYAIVRLKSVYRHQKKSCEGRGADRFCEDHGAGNALIIKVLAWRFTDERGKTLLKKGKAPKL